MNHNTSAATHKHFYPFLFLLLLLLLLVSAPLTTGLARETRIPPDNLASSPSSIVGILNVNSVTVDQTVNELLTISLAAGATPGDIQAIRVTRPQNWSAPTVDSISFFDSSASQTTIFNWITAIGPGA